MAYDLHFSMPDDFPKRIHEALRSWRSPKPENALSNLLLAREDQGAQSAVLPRLNSNKILLSGIEKLVTTQPEVATKAGR